MPVSFHSQKKISQNESQNSGEENNLEKNTEQKEVSENRINQVKISVNTTTLSNFDDKQRNSQNQKEEKSKFQTKNSGEPNAVHRVKFHLSKIVDKGIYVIAALGPLSAFDQAWQIWTTGNTNGVSLLMWLSWIPGAIFWLIYGILHRDKPIILTQSLWLVMQLAIVSGILFKK